MRFNFIINNYIHISQVTNLYVEWIDLNNLSRF